MLTLLVLQIIVIIALIIVVLMQNPSVDGLAGFNNSVDSGHMMAKSSGSGNLLSKVTYILAFLFIINNLCIMSVQSHKNAKHNRVIEEITHEVQAPTND